MQLTQEYRAKWWHRLADGRIQCDLCPRYCQLKAGQRGFCFVRMADEQGMLLTTYGRSSGFCIDPIEKKPLNHFYPGSSVLSFGTAGCNLGCRFCQNWDISKAREWDKLADQASPEQIARKAKELGCRSIAFTYNDPVIFAEYAMDTAKACHALGIKTVAVTAGYITPKARHDFYAVMDAANVDLKAFTQGFYQKLCFANLQPVLETLLYIKKETKTWLEITTLLIPGENDSSAEIEALSMWIYENLGPDVPLHFTAFHPDFKMTHLTNTPFDTLKMAREIAIKNGLNFVYTGNVHDSLGSSTYCPHCQKLVLERDWYQLGQFHIQNGCCQYCGTAIAGYFENQVGTWGAQRKQVSIN